MTIAIPRRPVPPSVELHLDSSLECELLDAAHRVLAPLFEPGNLIVRVVAGSDRDNGIVHVVLVDPVIAPEGMDMLSIQVVHMGPRHMTQVITTRLVLPEDLRGKGNGMALIESLYRVCADRGAALLLTGLNDIATARLQKRGGHRVDAGMVQITSRSRFG